MTRRLARVAALALVCALAATPAFARHHPARHPAHLAARASIAHGDPRPHAWCGWWLRQELRVADRTFNMARAWARYGANAHGPAAGVIVVWRHHVGLITGRAAEGWLVKSGNDGHAVRERVRSLSRAIAFRRPNGLAGL